MAKTHFSGPLQIGDQVTGTEYTILDDSNNNEILSVNPVDSATNNIGLRNAATGNNPIIYNAGEADTGLTFAGSDGTNFEEIIILDTNASAVNEVTIDNAVAGSNPSMAATGDDTNIGLQLSSKGTGVVVFGSTANGSAASGSAVVNAQRGYLIVNFTATGTAGTQTIDLVNNKLTASNILQCSIHINLNYQFW